MKEQDLEKAINLKGELDYERKLLNFAQKPYVELGVMLRERERNGEVFLMDRVLGDEGLAEIREKIISNIKVKIHSLELEIEKL